MPAFSPLPTLTSPLPPYSQHGPVHMYLQLAQPGRHACIKWSALAICPAALRGPALLDSRAPPTSTSEDSKAPCCSQEACPAPAFAALWQPAALPVDPSLPQYLGHLSAGAQQPGQTSWLQRRLLRGIKDSCQGFQASESTYCWTAVGGRWSAGLGPWQGQWRGAGNLRWAWLAPAAAAQQCLPSNCISASAAEAQQHLPSGCCLAPAAQRNSACQAAAAELLL